MNPPIAPTLRRPLVGVVTETTPSPDSIRARNSGPAPGILKVDTTAGCAIGIELAHRHYRVVVLNVIGEVIADSKAQPHNAEADFHGALTVATQTCHRLVRVPSDRVLGIGLALAAPMHLLQDPITGERQVRFRWDLGPKFQGDLSSPWSHSRR